MEKTIQSAHAVRFANFEADLDAGELRKSGLKLKFSGQPFEVLAILLEQPGAIVTREQLQKRLWPDSFVDFDHNLNSAINRIREALGDSAETPRFIETLPRRGYRFIAPVENVEAAKQSTQTFQKIQIEYVRASRHLSRWLVFGAIVLVLLAGASLVVYKAAKPSLPPRALTRLTFDDGLQTGATWSPDSRFIAYASNRGGKFDIWVQPVGGGDAVQITETPTNNWQPDWSPDGKYIAYRSDDAGGGIYIIPALGGAGLQKKITSFGYHPRWSPDGSQILFDIHFDQVADITNKFYVVDLNGNAPREVIANFPNVPEGERRAISAAWYPDGKHVTIEALFHATDPSFWMVPIEGGAAKRLRIVPRVSEELKKLSVSPQRREGTGSQFSWAPSGTAIYFEHLFRGTRNIWRLSIEPKSFTAVTLERVTTGRGEDRGPSISRDGTKLAFTSEAINSRPWLFPFDATHGRITGGGQALTPAGTFADRHNLSRDGKKVAVIRNYGEKFQLCVKLLPDGEMNPILTDDYLDYPQWSPDGKALAYVRRNLSTDEAQVLIWSEESHSQTLLGTLKSAIIFDWSTDGKSLLMSERNGSRLEIWQVPLASAPHAEAAQRKLISDPSYQLWQSHFSPDGRWIVFEGVTNSTNVESSIFLVPATGGPWTRITAGPQWDDKPRWSPDGKKIYFISNRDGRVFNLWGIDFDPLKGKAVGKPFRLTTFAPPGPLVSAPGRPELALTQDTLIMTIQERTGNVWILDNVDR